MSERRLSDRPVQLELFQAFPANEAAISEYGLDGGNRSTEVSTIGDIDRAPHASDADGWRDEMERRLDHIEIALLKAGPTYRGRLINGIMTDVWNDLRPAVKHALVAAGYVIAGLAVHWLLEVTHSIHYPVVGSIEVHNIAEWIDAAFVVVHAAKAIVLEIVETVERVRRSSFRSYSG